jgi:hypothetical protein
MERLDAALLSFSTATKGRFHNYLRHLHPGIMETDSASEFAATGRLSQCRRLDESFAHQHSRLDESGGSVTCRSLFVLLSFTGKLLTADQVCRMIPVLVGCGNGLLTPTVVARSLLREAVFTIPAAPRHLLYWAEGGFTA